MDSSAQYRNYFEQLQKSSHQFRQTSAKERIQILKSLETMILENQNSICEALKKDFAKPETESLLTEILPVIQELRYFKKKLPKWVAPKKVGTPLTLWGTRSFIQHQGKGCVLIMAPWNYPFQLAIAPLIAALAAGNTVILKPSELSGHTSELLKILIEKHLASNLVRVELGGPEVSKALLQLPFDHIFFTGSTAVGQLVMEAAAKNLTPVTLELGGKSPTIIDASANLQLAAKKIAWGKFVNAGQTCVAPDYVFVPQHLKQTFSELLMKELRSHYGEKSEDFAAIISPRHLERLQKFVDELKNSATTLLSLPQTDTRKISPTLAVDLPLDSKIMSEEIFGPILPIISYQNLGEVTEYINSQPKPLALYIFASNSAAIEKVLNLTSSGGVCINDTLIHLANHHLPFGGIGPSGMGHYHGYFGFKTFSHERAVMKQSSWNKILEFFYPPYSGLKIKILKWMIQYL